MPANRKLLTEKNVFEFAREAQPVPRVGRGQRCRAWAACVGAANGHVMLAGGGSVQALIDLVGGTQRLASAGVISNCHVLT